MTARSKGLLPGGDGQPRCFWAVGSSDYERYHDEEWGAVVREDKRLFEKICLEGFQAGLSWLTILRKRENFRRAFADFDHERVARYTSADVERLLQNAGIVRHRGKIEATINNARCAGPIVTEFGSLFRYFQQFVPPPSERPKKVTRAALEAMPKTSSSARMSRDLRSRGFRFVGPTTCYAFMQAMGLVDDHIEGCIARARGSR